jgi:RNA recognition motif-containing protein
MTRVYIGKISQDIREGDLESEFKRFGRLQKLDMKNGFAFAEYEDARDADDAVRDMDGRDVSAYVYIVQIVI